MTSVWSASVIAVALLMTSCASSGDDSTGVWQGPDGRPADRGEGTNTAYELRAFQGAEHCDLQEAVLLHIVWPPGTTWEADDDPKPNSRQYVRDPRGVLNRPALQERFDSNGGLPEESENTGFHRGDTGLWLGPDEGDDFIYLVTGDDVERWPRATPPIACE